MQQRVEQIEAEILKLAKENKERIDSALADPTFSNDAARLSLIQLEHMSVLQKIHNLQLEKAVIMLSLAYQASGAIDPK